MSRRIPADKRSEFGLELYLAVLGLIVLGIGFAAYGVMQPVRLANPGLAAYEAPAAVRALYPRPRTWLFADQIGAPRVATLDVSEPETTSSTTAQSGKDPSTAVPSTSRAERKARVASDRRKSAARAAARAREREREAIATYAHDYAWSSGYGSKWVW